MKIRGPQAVTVGASYPGTRLSIPSVGAGVAENIARLGDQAVGMLGQQRKVEDQEARRRGALEAADLLAQTEIGVQKWRDSLAEVTDPDEYLARLREGADTHAQEAFGRAKEPYAKDALAKQIPGLLATYDGQALVHSRGLRTAATKAKLGNLITNNEALASNAPLEDHDAFLRYVTSTMLAIDATSTTLGKDDADTLRRTTREAMFFDRANRHVNESPTGFLAAVERGEYSGADALGNYRGMKPAQLEAMKEKAGRLIVAQNTLEADQAEKREKYFADLLDKDTQALVGDFEERVRTVTSEPDRAGIVRDLNLRRELRQIKPGDYARLYDAAMKQNATPSHPDVLSRVGLDVESIRPTTTFAEIDRLHDAYRRGQPGLSFTDATRIKSKLRETTEALNNTAKADLRHDHAQVEQELRAVLGIKPGMIQQIMGDDPQARLWGEGLSELRRRSNVYSGKEAPLAVWRDMRERYVKASGQNAQLKAAEIVPLLYAPTREALEAAKPRISRELYLLELGKFDRLKALGWRPTTGSTEPTGTAPFKVGARGGDKK